MHPGAAGGHQRLLFSTRRKRRLFSCYDAWRGANGGPSVFGSFGFLTRMNHLLAKIGSVLASVMIGATFTFAQQGAPPGGSQSAPNQTRPQAVSPLLGTAATPNSSSAPGLAQPAYLTPISGVQGVLAETLDGATLAAQ